MHDESDTSPRVAHTATRRAASLALAAALVWLALATLLGFLGRIHWFLDLFSHFRAQYFALCFVLPAGLTLLRMWRWLALAGLVGAINAATLIPLWIGPDVPQVADAQPLRIVTFNVFAGNTDRNIAAITDFYRQQGAEIVVLLEPRWSRWRDHYAGPLRSAGYRVIAHTERNDNFDFMILSTLADARGSVSHFTQWNLPAAEIYFSWQGKTLALMAAHPPPPTSALNARARDAYLGEVARWARRQPVPAIVAGDFNATPWSQIFALLLETGGLVNSQRGFGIQPTWCDTCGPMRIPIDHVLHSRDLVTTYREVGPNLGSDHSPVYVELRWRAD